MGNEASSSAAKVIGDIHGNIGQRIDKFYDKQEESRHDDVVVINNRRNFIRREYLDAKPHELMTPKQIKTIRESWSILQHVIDEVGVLTFLQLFESHPAAKDTFKLFRDISTDDLHQSEIFHNHASRVMNVIKKVVEKIDQPEAYITYLTILGQKHIMYEADTRFIDQMGYMFLVAIKPALEKENAWNEETRDAWERLLVVVIGTMQKAIAAGL